MTSLSYSKIMDGNVSILIRSGVSLREHVVTKGAIYYLSIFDDEIDDRMQRFLGRLLDFKSISGIESLQELGADMELSDAVIFRQLGDRVIVLKGGSCNIPLYWNAPANRLELSTFLPLDDDPVLSKSGLLSYITALSLNGQHPQNAFTETPLDKWLRIRRGMVTVFQADKLILESPFLCPYVSKDPLNEEVVTDAVQDSFHKFSQSQRHVRSSILELSGGYDSTLAGRFALSAPHKMLGVSLKYPHYEFRFEDDIQKAVGESLSIPRLTIDGTELLPFSLPDSSIRFDEPTVFVTGARHAEAVAKIAKHADATKIYVGHGGDVLFSCNLYAPQEPNIINYREVVSKNASGIVAGVLQQIHNPMYRQRNTGCFAYDGIQDIWIKEVYGAMIRTPFNDLALYKAALMWSAFCNQRGLDPDKRILKDGLPNYLPSEVVNRKGKVSYDGLWARAYSRYGEAIASTIDRTSGILEFIGISPKLVFAQIRKLQSWQSMSGDSVIAAYAISSWLNSRGIHNISGRRWV